ncbi:MAG: caspase domain-containing protein [Roseobacter sp.]
MQTIVRNILAAGLTVLMLSAPTLLSAASYALLVGVSDYEDSTGIADLRGPVNDVALLRDVLIQHQDFEVQILADGVPGALRPTRAAILAALEGLALKAKAGDLVYIHLSGHGTQQPDDNGDESDGLDEVFLPADTLKADPGGTEIPNAIRDEELGAAVAAIRKRGADVWFVLDSCHSGSGLRAYAPDVATRFVDPSSLGISSTGSVSPRDDTPLEGPGDDDLPGKYIAFYAAQSSELARELEFDPNAASGNGWYGLFTSRLAARLSDGGAISYRQLFQAVLSDMNNAGIPGGARLQTPLWEGNMIDANVLGGQDTIGIRQHAVAGDTVSAGLLHGLVTGTVLALVDDATAGLGDEDVAGFAQVVSATAQSAFLAPVAQACVPDPTALCAPVGALPPAALFARVVAHPIDLTLRLSVPVALQSNSPVPQDDPMYIALIAAVDRVNADQSARIEIVETGADISVGHHQGALWFGPRVVAGDSVVGLQWSSDGAELDALLLRMFRAERLARMLNSVASGGSLLFGNPIKVNAILNDTDMQNRSVDVTSGRALIEECRSALAAVNLRDLPRSETLNQCDQLLFKAKGTVQGGARDVNRIYIDSQYCVEAAYARVEGTTAPAQLGGPITLCADCPDAGSITQKAGAERLFVVVTETRDNAEALDLRGLVENCTASGLRAGSRSAGTSGPVAAFLESVGTRSGLRGSLDGVGISNIWVERYDWQVLPRRESLIRDGIDVQ